MSCADELELQKARAADCAYELTAAIETLDYLGRADGSGSHMRWDNQWDMLRRRLRMALENCRQPVFVNS